MADRARLQNELIGRYPGPWVRHHLASFPDDYFAAFAADAVARHLDQMMALTDERPIAAEARPEAPDSWSVEVVGYDVFQLLSTVCSLLAIHGLVIVEGWAFTSDPKRAPPPRRPPGRAMRVRMGRPAAPATDRGPDYRSRVVDWFRVRPAEGQPAPDWDAFAAELADLVRLLRADRFEEVHHRLIPRFVAAMGRREPEPGPDREGEGEGTDFEPLDLMIDADEADFATVVRVGAADRFGFLSRTTSALALCGIRIVQADIRTRGGRVADTFWVTDRYGRRIDDGPRLRELRLSLTLIDHCSRYLPHATDPEAALVHFSRFAGETMARPDWAEGYAALDRPEVLGALVRVLGESDFLWKDYLHAQPENLLRMIADPGHWRQARSPSELAADRDAALALDPPALDDQARALRRFRDREFFRAGVRAILGQSGGPEGFSAELSAVAEAVLQGADRIVRHEFAATLPRRGDGLPVAWTLLALGKLGGRELGFGSDLELMLVYDDRDVAEVVGGPAVGASLDRVVAALRRVLTARRGGTFDVDFRLRPHGKGGPPATALSAFADYYRAGGAAWGYERQALIKLRTVAGDPDLGREVEALRDRFVYGPEPFDLEGCRRLRRLQVEQLVRPGTVNAKYSPGALVDVEYFVQALQMTHGATEPAVRTPSTLRAIAALAACRRLDPDRAERLRLGYTFFRKLIDALRVVHGHGKDLTVPPAGSDEYRALSRRLHLPDPAELEAELARSIQSIKSLWDNAELLLLGGG